MAPYNMLSHALFRQLSSQCCHKAVILMTLNYTRHRRPRDLSKQPLEQMKPGLRAQYVALGFNLATSNNVVFMLAWVKPMQFQYH